MSPLRSVIKVRPCCRRRCCFKVLGRRGASGSLEKRLAGRIKVAQSWKVCRFRSGPVALFKQVWFGGSDGDRGGLGIDLFGAKIGFKIVWSTNFRFQFFDLQRYFSFGWRVQLLEFGFRFHMGRVFANDKVISLSLATGGGTLERRIDIIGIMVFVVIVIIVIVIRFVVIIPADGVMITGFLVIILGMVLFEVFVDGFGRKNDVGRVTIMIVHY